MKRLGAVLVAATALVAFTATPATAQDLADLPRLGFEVNPNEGFVGDIVDAQVDPDDIEQHCYSMLPPLIEEWQQGLITDEQLINSFTVQWSMYWIPGDTLAFTPPDVSALLAAHFGDFAFNENPGRQIVTAARDSGVVPDGVPQTEEGELFTFRVLAAMATITSAIAGEVLPQLYEAFHVLTFVEPATQEMVGDMSNFNPDTGEGQIAVPDLPPTLYAIAAACVEPVPYDQLPQALANGVVAAWNWSVENDMFPTGSTQAGWQDWAEAGGLPALIGEIVQPRAIGIDFYCILDPDGLCATPPGPPPNLIADLVDPNGNGPGTAPNGTGPGTDGDPHPAHATTATPTFTG